MRISPDEHTVEADDFARRFSMRPGRLMWLLGAGASAAAGIPTAWDMIWDFKQQLYVSQRKVSAKTVSDFSNPAVRSILQSYIDGAENLPAAGAPDEYAALFEAAWPSESDRQTYIAGKLSGAKPSYGHIALATLMCAGHTKVVWTTNFDPLIADACAKVYDGTGPLTTVSLDTPGLGREVMTSERWPAEVKLHGDFRSRRLKNTPDELRDQDAQLRRLLIDACHRAGLVVAGYSGRDDSIMDALAEVLSKPDPFPGGLFWLHRGEDPPLARVHDLLQAAATAGVDGGLVRVDNFDETLRDAVRLLPNLDMAALEAFASERQIVSAPAKMSGPQGFPVIRLNGLPLLQTPTVCRRVVCDAGGAAEVALAIEEAGVDVLAARTQAGVLAFGADNDVRIALAKYRVEAFDLHSIETRRLRYDSGERGLLRRALSRALSREHDLTLMRRRSADLLAPSNPGAATWGPLRTIVGPLAGAVPKHPELTWREGFGARLDWADDRLWLLIEPRTIFDGVTPENRFVSQDFARERTVKRYNRKLNELIDFWAHLLSKDGADLSALATGAGVDAVFRLGADTAFSRRARA